MDKTETSPSLQESSAVITKENFLKRERRKKKVFMDINIPTDNITSKSYNRKWFKFPCRKGTCSRIMAVQTSPKSSSSVKFIIPFSGGRYA